MPAIANFTVKLADNTTDATFVAKSPSAGDNVPAVWRYDASAAPYNSLKPEVRLTARWNGGKTARRLDVMFVYPSWVTNTTTGVAEKRGAIVATVSVAMPQDLPQIDQDNAAALLGNILDHSLIQSCLTTGYSAT